MKTKFIYLSSLLSCLMLGMPANSLAKSINLYAKPDTHAKIVAKADLSAGIMPIYTPKKGNWIKVADPRNGNVGWVKSSDINAETTQSLFNFIQSNTTDGKHTLQVFQFGQPKKMTSEEANAIAKQIMAKRQAARESIQKTMQNMHQLMEQEWSMIDHTFFPIMMPVVVVPVKQETVKKSTTGPSQKTLSGTNRPDKDGS